MRLVPGENTIILTLNDSVTLDSPDFILIFESALGRKTGCVLGTDLSEYPTRNNEFVITLMADPDNSDAEVQLVDKTHRYYVYEIADASGFDFDNIGDLTEMDGEVEKGIAHYIETGVTHKYFRNTRTTSKSYNGG